MDVVAFNTVHIPLLGKNCCILPHRGSKASRCCPVDPRMSSLMFCGPVAEFCRILLNGSNIQIEGSEALIIAINRLVLVESVSGAAEIAPVGKVPDVLIRWIVMPFRV